MIDLLALVAALIITALVFHRLGVLRGSAALLAGVPALALGSLSLATFGLLLLGVRLTAWVLAPAFTVVLLYLAAIARGWQAHEGDTPAPTRTAARPLWPARPIVAILVVVTALFLSWAGWRCLASWPHGAADAVYIWTSRALLLVRADGDIPARLALMRGGHPDYPLLLPTVVAAQYAASGGESLAIPQATSILWLIGLLAATFAVTSRFTDPPVATLATLAVAVNPLLVRWALVQCADVPVAYLLLLAAGAMVTNLRDRGDLLFSPPLAGFFTGLLMWSKNEGIVLAAMLIGMAATHGLARRRAIGDLPRRAGYFALGFAPSLTALLLFRRLWLRSVDTPGFLPADALDRIVDLDRWRVLLSAAAYEATFPGHMNVSAALVPALAVIVVVVLVARRRTVPAVAGPLLAVPAVAALLYVGAYMMSPYDLQWHVSTSVDRLMLQLMPTLVVGAALLLAAPPVHRPDMATAVGPGGPGGRDPK